MLNHKINAFVASQVSFLCGSEVFHDYVIEENNFIIAGTRICFYVGKCWDIKVLFMYENYRGKELGALLFNQVEADARIMGAKLIHLEPFYRQAKDFYLNHGDDLVNLHHLLYQITQEKCFNIILLRFTSYKLSPTPPLNRFFICQIPYVRWWKIEPNALFFLFK